MKNLNITPEFISAVLGFPTEVLAGSFKRNTFVIAGLSLEPDHQGHTLEEWETLDALITEGFINHDLFDLVINLDTFLELCRLYFLGLGLEFSAQVKRENGQPLYYCQLLEWHLAQRGFKYKCNIGGPIEDRRKCLLSGMLTALRV